MAIITNIARRLRTAANTILSIGTITDGQFLKRVGTEIVSASVSSGIGGSTGATDNAILRADGTGGGTLQNSAVTIDDSGNISGWASLNPLVREDGNTVAQRDSTNPQQFLSYNTYTDALNNERAVMSWNVNANEFDISTLKSGSGTLRSLRIGVDLVNLNKPSIFFDGPNNLTIFGTSGSTRWVIRDTGDFVANVDGAVNIGGSGGTPGLARPGTIFLASGIAIEATITAGGTTGAQTINKTAGSVNFAGGASSLVVTNDKVTANSLVFCAVLTNDATAVIKNVVPGSGTFTITLSAAATGETKVGFWVLTPD